MFKDTKAFSSFSVQDIPLAKRFYQDVLGLSVSDENGFLKIHLAGGGEVLVYPKADHVPAAFTIMNFPTGDIYSTVNKLKQKGIEFIHYPDTDKDGVTHNEGPLIAWFKDPSGNFLSVIHDESLSVGDKLNVSRFIPQECDMIFKAWTEPALLEKWSYPEGMSLKVSHYDLHPGGTFKFIHSSPDGELVTLGTFREIIENERLVYDLEVTTPDGKKLPKNTMTVNFSDEFSGTNIEIIQEGFQDQEVLSECEKGTVESLERLNYILTSGVAEQVMTSGMDSSDQALQQ